MYSYSELFYEYQREGSAQSARGVLPRVIDALKVKSVLDVGCGAGAWLGEYKKLGVDDLCGVDGDYVDRSLLLIDEQRFLPKDISKPFSLGRQFDLVQCLEVGEHVPRELSGALVDNIVGHGKCVLFSAAVPGQGGENHINEQPYEYWRDLFAARSYRLFDFVRPQIVNEMQVEHWYRYNLLFFAHDDAIGSLPASVTATRVDETEPVRDVSPIAYRARKSIMRLLPPSTVSVLAKMKHRMVVRSARSA